MVLDVSKFMYLHPGGQFSLKQNIGRDVSKFFHGGYSLENIKEVKNHLHSSDARRIVNSLIIGILSDQAPMKLMKIESSEKNANKTGTAVTFKFKEVGYGNGLNKVQDSSAQSLLK